MYRGAAFDCPCLTLTLATLEGLLVYFDNIRFMSVFLLRQYFSVEFAVEYVTKAKGEGGDATEVQQMDRQIQAGQK